MNRCIGSLQDVARVVQETAHVAVFPAEGAISGAVKPMHTSTPSGGTRFDRVYFSVNHISQFKADY